MTLCSLAVLAGLLVWMAAFAVTHSEAAPKANLGSCGKPNGSAGGQLTFAKGVAVNRSGIGAPAGSVYVAEAASNHRISQYSAECTFIRTWGYDVVKAGEENDTGTGFEICDVTAPEPLRNELEDCKAGLTGGAAGQLANPQGIAVDQSNGYLYVTSIGNRRVDVFSGVGQFAGAFGYDVLPADPNPAGPDFCTTATGCQAAPATAGAQAGRFSNLTGATPAVDPSLPGRVFVPDNGNLRVAQYSTTIAGGVLTAVSFDKAFGWGVDTGAAQLESCTLVSECQVGLSGNGAGQFTTGGSPTAVGVDSNGFIYVTSGPLTSGTCSAATPCRIQKFAPDATSAIDFGPTSGPGQLVFTAGAANAVAGINLAVDPANDHVFVLRKEGTTSYRILEYDSSGTLMETHPAGAALTGVAATQSTGVAVGTDERIYTNYGAGGGGELIVLGPVPDAEVEVTSVEDITSTSAHFEGLVTIPSPGGPGFEAKYHFEYSSNGVQWKSTPEQVTGSIAQDYEVEADVAELSPNTDYQVRLVATTSDTVTSEPKFFKTLATAPRVALTYSEEVTQTTAELGAHIDPEGTSTTYHFEWATEEGFEETGTYDRRVPAFERQIGEGNKVVIVQDEITGLEPATAYRFRVVASSAEGTTPGPDQRFETLNSCGLTGDRCFELVSPADKGPVGAAGEVVSLGQELRFQAAPTGSTIAYEVAYGFPDSTAPDESVYQANWTGSEWLSTQLSPAPTVVPPTEFGSKASKALFLSEDLSCGIFVSSQPLTDDTPSEALDAGLGNLYRRGSQGEWTLITNLDPTVISPSLVAMEEFDVVGASPDCNRVIFRTAFQYPGIPGAGVLRLYEWDSGSLKGIASIPGPGGSAVEVIPGEARLGSGGALGGVVSTNYWNAVSDDASRVYFTAVSKEGDDLGERAIFLREDGGATVTDVSQSQAASLPGGSPNNAASVYQTASTDGSEVFFLGRYGLAPNEDGTAAETSTGATSCSADGTGCDLYRYSVEDGTLTDLSVPDAGTGNAKGASVVGVLGASDDGSRVYFAARGQLVAGAGSTEASNIAAGTYNIYLSEGGTLDYVGRLGEEGAEPDISLIRASQGGNSPWSSRVTPDGGHLLFETRANVTGYESDGKAEAYLYDASSDSTLCVSCRKDGQPSVADEFFYRPLASGVDASNRDNPPRTISDDGERVFFISPNRLASGATEGKEALYLWEDGQISFIADSVPGSGFELQFAGASASGDDLYFTTLDQLTWQDRDGQLDLYDARVGGGIPQPPAPPAPCDPLSESSCGGGSGATPAALPPASSTFTGPGNPPASEKPKRKAQKKKGKKKGKGKRGGKRTGKGKRGTSSTGRTK